MKNNPNLLSRWKFIEASSKTFAGIAILPNLYSLGMEATKLIHRPYRKRYKLE